MADAPICTVHKSPMRQNANNGSWFCPRKNGDSWCSEKMSKKQWEDQTPRPATPAPAPNGGATAPVPYFNERDGYKGQVALGAFELAAALFHGSAGEPAAEEAAIAYAINAYRRMLEEL
jgi:hypothetical protein